MLAMSASRVLFGDRIAGHAWRILQEHGCRGTTRIGCRSHHRPQRTVRRDPMRRSDPVWSTPIGTHRSRPRLRRLRRLRRSRRRPPRRRPCPSTAGRRAGARPCSTRARRKASRHLAWAHHRICRRSVPIRQLVTRRRWCDIQPDRLPRRCGLGLRRIAVP